jgi:hypothetical protein
MHTTVAEVGEQTGQGGHVVDVLQAFAYGFEHDREPGVVTGHGEQLRAALALLPQRRTPFGIAAGQQQCPGGALPKARGEQRAAADGRRQAGGDIVGVYQESLADLLEHRLVVGVGNPHDDAVVGVHHLHIHTDGLLQPRGGH